MILSKRLLALVWFFCLAPCVFAFSSASNITSESAKADSFSFVVFGDNRDGDKIFTDLIAKANKEKNISFALNTGDMVSHGREEEYKKYLQMISKLKVKTYPVAGNHDLVKDGYRHYRKYFGPFYYSFDYGNSHFIVLNNAFQNSFHAKQFAWLKKDLAKTSKENIFIFMHRPVFDPSEIYKGYIMSGRKVIEELMGLFERYKVDYVFAGHIHGYARAERNGIVYIVTGGGGAPLYLPTELGGFYHYVKVRVDGGDIMDEAVRVYD